MWQMHKRPIHYSVVATREAHIHRTSLRVCRIGQWATGDARDNTSDEFVNFCSVQCIKCYSADGSVCRICNKCRTSTSKFLLSIDASVYGRRPYHGVRYHLQELCVCFAERRNPYSRHTFPLQSDLGGTAAVRVQQSEMKIARRSGGSGAVPIRTTVEQRIECGVCVCTCIGIGTDAWQRASFCLQTEFPCRTGMKHIFSFSCIWFVALCTSKHRLVRSSNFPFHAPSTSSRLFLFFVARISTDSRESFLI